MIVAISDNKGLEILKFLGINIIGKKVLNDLVELEKTLKSAKILIIEEDLYEKSAHLLNLVQKQGGEKLILVIPSKDKDVTSRMDYIYNQLSRAVGVQLKVKARGD